MPRHSARVSVPGEAGNPKKPEPARHPGASGTSRKHISAPSLSAATLLASAACALRPAVKKCAESGPETGGRAFGVRECAPSYRRPGASFVHGREAQTPADFRASGATKPVAAPRQPKCLHSAPEARGGRGAANAASKHAAARA
eukprot:scaffold1150_cov135-Isochrysis_galbana.AAC.2